MITVIKPSLITDIVVPEVVSDISKLKDVAGEQVNLVLAALSKFEIIETDEQKTNAMVTMKEASTIGKAIEDKRKELGAPYTAEKVKIDVYAKDLTGKIDAKIATIKDTVLKFTQKQTQIALEKRTNERQTILYNLGFAYNGDRDEYRIDGVGAMSGNEIKNYDDKSFNMITAGFTEGIKKKAAEELAKLNEEAEMVQMFGDEIQVQQHTEKIAQASAVIPAAPKYVPSFGGSTPSTKGITKRWVFEITDSSLIPKEFLMVNEVAIRQAVLAGERTIPGVNIFQSESISLR